MVALTYFVITVILYLYGPVPFIRHNVVFTVTLLVIYQLAFASGYLGILKKESLRPRQSSLDRLSALKVAKAIVVIGLMVAVINLYIYTPVQNISVSSIISSVQVSLDNPGETYFDSFENVGISGPFIWGLVLLSPISWSAFAVSVAYFRDFGLIFRVLTVALFLLEASRWVLNGRNKGAFDLVIIIAVVMWVRTAGKRANDEAKRQVPRTQGLLKIAVVAALLALVLTVFTNAISSRTNSMSSFTIPEHSVLVSITPLALQPMLIAVTMYLTQGYHALSFVSELDWMPTFGAGHSWFLTSRLESVFGIDIFPNTYQASMAGVGIKPFVNWHSFYVWAANDLHWLGVIPLMFLIGRFSARVVMRALIDPSPARFAMVGMVAILVAYLPANAQVFQEPGTFVAFWGLFIYIHFKDRRSDQRTKLAEKRGVDLLRIE